eukprot:TRINITY_DN112647_c0_g1_i1.p1 TRINITY_DN112647_c0_g1~~TRINITY_DN112647_c0_g1_i1.p1  ORF type:complete len:357 (-),score=51.59 TRINITY_DN112647_c0_g1_i1:80-1150(-)
MIIKKHPTDGNKLKIQEVETMLWGTTCKRNPLQVVGEPPPANPTNKTMNSSNNNSTLNSPNNNNGHINNDSALTSPNRPQTAAGMHDIGAALLGRPSTAQGKLQAAESKEAAINDVLGRSSSSIKIRIQSSPHLSPRQNLTNTQQTSTSNPGNNTTQVSRSLVGGPGQYVHRNSHYVTESNNAPQTQGDKEKHRNKEEKAHTPLQPPLPGQTPLITLPNHNTSTAPTPGTPFVDLADVACSFSQQNSANDSGISYEDILMWTDEIQPPPPGDDPSRLVAEIINHNTRRHHHRSHSSHHQQQVANTTTHPHQTPTTVVQVQPHNSNHATTPNQSYHRRRLQSAQEQSKKINLNITVN